MTYGEEDNEQPFADKPLSITIYGDQGHTKLYKMGPEEEVKREDKNEEDNKKDNSGEEDSLNENKARGEEASEGNKGENEEDKKMQKFQVRIHSEAYI